MKVKGETPDNSGVSAESPVALEQGLGGQELDAAVAERVMGWKHLGGSATGNQFFADENDDRYTVGDSNLIRCWSPSRDITTAMEVVEKMRSDGWSFACTLYEGELPYASFCKRTAVSSRNAEAVSLPEAICRAALQATATASAHPPGPVE